MQSTAAQSFDFPAEAWAQRRPQTRPALARVSIDSTAPLTRTSVSQDDAYAEREIGEAGSALPLPLLPEQTGQLSERAPLLSGSLVERSDARKTSQVVAEWHGQVLTVYENYFVAELKGTIGEGVAGGFEEAQIPIGDLNPGDLELLREGAFFRLCVSYETALTGSRRRFTEVIFRRMPAYRREELEAARAVAAELARGIRVE